MPTTTSHQRQALESSAMASADRLEHYYQQIKAIILTRQSPITGLLPASTAVNQHGDYTDAWVRDNVYSILAVWGLGLAYRQAELAPARTYELEQSVIKLMRGLLTAMMKQAHKVERFKQTQHPLDAMHAKYDTHSGNAVVGDHEWGHLQLDATSIYLLMLVQMIASGLNIIQSYDEVDFVQNLVYYINRTYRTPDFGIWERGNKINHGNPELNASSIGMAKAALEAINGFNLFGAHGGTDSVVHVQPDDIARSRLTLESLLPRESNSKEVDAALLSIIGYPAFAVDDEALAQRTRQKILDTLAGNYGCKRFLRDGHQTVIEDPHRLHYEVSELQQFQHIECEWPLFFTYLALDGLFRQDAAAAQHYSDRLQSLLVEHNGRSLLPELYFVPAEHIEAERAQPNSQPRQPNENVPLIWAQSLYWLGQLIIEGFIELSDIDPIGRHQRPQPKSALPVQVALIAETQALQSRLQQQGIATQTPEDVQPIQILKAETLTQAYHHFRSNAKLGLSGRPQRRMRSLSTAELYRFKGSIIAFQPSFLDQNQFYLTLDYHFLVDQIKTELTYIYEQWTHDSQPTLTLVITELMMADGLEPLVNFFKTLQSGNCNGIPVQLGQLPQFVSQASIVEMAELCGDVALMEVQTQISPTLQAAQAEESTPLAPTQELDLECETNVRQILDQLCSTSNLYERIELLQTLSHLEDLNFDTAFGESEPAITIQQLLEEAYANACDLRLWSIIRRAAGLLEKVDIRLSDAITSILIRQKQVAVGKAYSQASLITQPMSEREAMEKIQSFCGEDIRDRVLTQEILINLALLIKTEPHLFTDLLTLRVGALIVLMTNTLAQDCDLDLAQAYEKLMSLSPFAVKERLRAVLASYGTLSQAQFQQESLHLRPSLQSIEWVVEPESNAVENQPGSWLNKRELQGMMHRVPPNFYPRVWNLLKHCQGLVIGDKLEGRNRLDSGHILSEMTPGEKNFDLCIDHLLHKVESPKYRQLNIEALMELSALVETNADLYLEDHLVMDVLIGHAVRLAYLDQHPDRGDRYDEFKSDAWQDFYQSPPHRCAQFTAAALRFLTELGAEV